VAAGEEVVITRRGEPVASLVPAEPGAAGSGMTKRRCHAGRLRAPPDELLARSTVKVLLDTHIFLWLHTERKRLSEALRCSKTVTERLLSAVVVEIAIKHQLRTAALPNRRSATYKPDARDRAVGVPIEHSHARRRLKPLHDPFDRLLIAPPSCSTSNRTAGTAIAQYPVSTCRRGRRLTRCCDDWR
jgi:PIN domain nuclease of toxin-antitoxin system